MIVRRVLVVALGLLLAAQVGRVAALRTLSRPSPAAAATVWPGHPSVEIELGLIAIAEAARQGRPVEQETLARLFSASARAPLATEPFLVRGVQAQLTGDTGLAERAFSAARTRDGRSLPARYFLADLYLRNGDAGRGLAEVAVLARLTPEGSSKLAPYVASYARNRANWPLVRTMFAREPALEETSLRALAADAGNAEAVLALASPRRRNVDSSWLPVLVTSLTEAGQHGKARQIWSDVTGAAGPADGLIFDPQFRIATAPPPFNWSLTSSTVGMAERQRGRGLNVIFYGQEDGVLAAQLLILPPGRYRLVTDAPNPPPGAANLRWALVCARGNADIASLPFDKASREGWRFAVPASCPAQRLELVGTATDMARQTELTIRSVRLEREQPGG